MIRLQELGFGLDAQAVDQFLRNESSQAGVVNVAAECIARRLNSTRPRVRRAIDALCSGTRSDTDDRPLLLFDASTCVGYFPGHVDDFSPGTVLNADKRARWIFERFPNCPPRAAALRELELWKIDFEAKAYHRRPQQGRLSLVSDRRRVQE